MNKKLMFILAATATLFLLSGCNATGSSKVNSAAISGNNALSSALSSVESGVVSSTSSFVNSMTSSQ